ncbi:hypothetical protein MP638_001387 [Amoeboaphelidium occidentale]|nr:hypothetical protein MP638_001387 [Amoeboaphelidium occidentale]
MTHRSGIIVLISGDIDFAETLHDLVHTGGYTVILIHNGHARLELRNNASELRDFEDVVSDNSLITKKFTTPSKKAATEESLWSCEVCGKTFASQKARDSHVEATGHLNECNECGKTFQSKLSLKQHQDSLMHGSVKCNECGKEFQSSKSLEQHQNATGHISVSCDDCGNIFTSLQRIHQHMARKNHSGSSSWECRQCPDDAPWYSLSDLLDHLRLDH